MGMVVHEFVLEKASYTFAHLASLPAAVTLAQFAACAMFPLVLGRRDVLRSRPRTFRKLLEYLRLSLLVFGATAFSTASLSFVSYPVKIIFKSVKLIPTMAISTLLHNKIYGPWEYVAAAMLCLGAAGYAHQPGTGSGGDDDSSSSVIGIGMLIVSIVCDSLVPNLQQGLMAGDDLSSLQLMAYVNGVGLVCLAFFMLVSGSLAECFQAMVSEPLLLVYLAGIGVSLSASVLAYTQIIKASGSVTAVAVATLRKVTTMILSYVAFPKPITQIHVASGLLVLGGILLSQYAKGRKC